ncbi:MAG: hypothetical protein J6M62_05695 [Selenomonadaceae bacterium]|nr:hypothetical protein [Selenomonadaceae bacterium]MBP3722621.1 hypothetical protein [Selenomonadaceae bacterium]
MKLRPVATAASRIPAYPLTTLDIRPTNATCAPAVRHPWKRPIPLSDDGAYPFI